MDMTVDTVNWVKKRGMTCSVGPRVEIQVATRRTASIRGIQLHFKVVQLKKMSNIIMSNLRFESILYIEVA